jgi:hypothetical protein
VLTIHKPKYARSLACLPAKSYQVVASSSLFQVFVCETN